MDNYVFKVILPATQAVFCVISNSKRYLTHREYYILRTRAKVIL